MFVPLPAEKRAVGDQPEILGYTMQRSDDGKSALVEFVGKTPQSLAFITQSKAPGVKAFERGKATKTEVETEFRKHKREFDLDSFQGRGNAKGVTK
jgi:hypothetical protein